MADKANKTTELGEEIPVKEPKKVTAPKKTAKKYEPNDLIECRSVTGGELILVGMKSKLQYNWADYGDVAYVEYQDLQALQSRKAKFLVKPRVIIEDADLVEQWGSMLKPIYDKINNQDIEALFKLKPDKFRYVLSNMPTGIKDAIKTKAVQMIKSEELYDLRLIKIIDEVLGTEFAEMLLG